MPEPSPDGCGRVLRRRPQPRPRRSLAVCSKNGQQQQRSPLYENLNKVHHSVQAKKEELLLCSDNNGNDKNTPADQGNNISSMTAPNSNNFRWNAPTGFRRSTLPVATFSSSSSSVSGVNATTVLARRNANTLDSKLNVSVPATGRTFLGVAGRGSGGLHGTFKSSTGGSVEPSAAGATASSANASTVQSTASIKCMPYNSPRLSKSPKVADSTITQSCDKLSTSTVVCSRSRYRLARAVNADTGSSQESLNSDNGAIANFRSQPLTASLRGINKQQAVNPRMPSGTTRCASVERLSDSSSSMCSIDSLLGSCKADGETIPDTEDVEALKAGYRKSVSIPPQMVATLASQFNALITQHSTQNGVLHPRESPPSATEKVSTATLVKCPSPAPPPPPPPSSLPITTRSCPSSPSYKPGRTYQKQRVLQQHQVGVGNTSIIGRGRPRGYSVFPNDKGYASATEGNESSDTESVGSGRWRRSSLPKTSTSAPLSIVQQAIQNYEGALKKAVSSPKLQRKASDKPVDDSVDSAQQVPIFRTRQVQTLPTTVTTHAPVRCSLKSQTQVMVQSLPQLSWRGSSIAPTTQANCSLAPPKEIASREMFLPALPAKAPRTRIPPVATQRTSLLSSRLKSESLSDDTAGGKSFPVLSKVSVRSISVNGIETVHHARPAVVVNRTVVPGKALQTTVAKPASHLETEAGRLSADCLFARKAAISIGSCSEEKIIEHSCTLDMHMENDDSTLDLLAEIDNHPRILAAVAGSRTKQWSSLGSQQEHLVASHDKDSGKECFLQQQQGTTTAPNISFLWKRSTQVVTRRLPNLPQSSLQIGSIGFRSTEMHNGLSMSTMNDTVTEPLVDGGSGYYDDEEHLYEELANCISRSSRRMDVPYPLPENDDDVAEMITPEDDQGEQDNTFDNKIVEESSSRECLKDDDSDDSWIDESEDEDRVSRNAKLSKLRGKGKRTSQRKVMTRHSWSQSLRDLANSGLADRDCGEAPWTEDDEIGSDCSSTRHIYMEPILMNNCRRVDDTDGGVTDLASPDTDTDKSPTSVPNGVVAGDVVRNKHTSKADKKVKRNWSWSKTDFRLDISSKLGRIRMNKKQHNVPAEILSSAEGGGGGDARSPTKKKQWPFKCKNQASKKTATVGTTSPPKESPSPRESAQFYVPTVNADGTLASPPGSLANLDFPQAIIIASHQSSSGSTVEGGGKAAESSGSAINSELAIVTAAIKKSRRISSGGTVVSRPKTAPPAPPVSLSKSTGPTLQPSGPQSVAEVPEASTKQLKTDNVKGINVPGQPPSHGTVKRQSSDTSSNSSGRQSDTEITKSGLIGLSAAGLDANNLSRPKLRQSVSSVTSGSSYESCSTTSRVEEIDAVSSSEGGILPKFLQTQNSSQDITKTEERGSSPRGLLYLDDTYYIDDERNMKLSPFEDEPLYQFYNINAQQRAAHENQMDSSDDDCYESLYQMAPSLATSTESTTGSNIPSAMDLVKSTEGGMRTLWCEVPEVVASGLLETMTSQQRKMQEAMFEVITSEASYLKSLNVLVNNFIFCPFFSDDYSMDCILNKRDRHVLFSDVIPVKAACERLLTALEKRWQEGIVISDICDILQEQATEHFDVYVKYCSNQIYQDRCLKKLKETNPQFVEVLKTLEAHPVCQNLSMYSFLMLPMQRITRLPLLVDAIFKHLDYGTKQFETCKQALATINKIVHECNEGALRMERMEEMLTISRQLDFRDFKGVALISASRWLVKKGELNRLLFGETSKLHFGRRCTKQTVHLFLFTDLLIIAKKKSDDCYYVVDYCPRNMVQVMEIEGPDQLPERPPEGCCKNLFQLIMLQNHDKKTVELYFSCSKESDLTRWIEAVTPKKSENPDERIYEEWDCPQVQAIHSYVAQQPDELSLEESDVVNVFRKMVDGWYQGERIRDGVQGWFPSTYTVEIVSSHVRARNLRQRYRLLALSHSYLEEQRKKEKQLK